MVAVQYVEIASEVLARATEVAVSYGRQYCVSTLCMPIDRPERPHIPSFIVLVYGVRFQYPVLPVVPIARLVTDLFLHLQQRDVHALWNAVWRRGKVERSPPVSGFD